MPDLPLLLACFGGQHSLEEQLGIPDISCTCAEDCTASVLRLHTYTYTYAASTQECACVRGCHGNSSKATIQVVGAAVAPMVKDTLYRPMHVLLKSEESCGALDHYSNCCGCKLLVYDQAG